MFGKIRFYLIDQLRGLTILEQLKIISSQEYLPSATLSAMSVAKYRQIIDYAKASIPYYKQFSSSSNWPVLTKSFIKSRINDFISPSFIGDLLIKNTGGSTGSPLVYYTTKKAQSFMWAGIIHSWRLAGYTLGDRVAFLSGTALAKRDWKHRLFYGLMNITIYSAYTLNEQYLKKYLDDIISSKIQLIYGYPTALNELALYILKHGKFDFPHLKGIVVTSEVLEEKHRLNIELAFQVIVRNQYGCNEAGVSAFECEYGKMHLINTASHITQDDSGNLFATNLINEAFYFINYDTGDKVVMSSNNRCSCKRGYPIIEKVIGRSVDLIIDSQGKKIHSAFFTILFRNDPDIEQFQVQFNEHEVDIYLKVDELKFKEEKKKYYLEKIRNGMQFEKYNLHLNAPFFLSANAKHKYVVDNRKSK